MRTQEQIVNLFRNFSIKECKGSSDLYEYLAIKIAEDEEVLTLSSYAQAGQPVPNLLLGAVHYLLLAGKEHHLKTYYSSLVESANTDLDQAFHHFKDFCKMYREEIITLLQTKLVQTNEVRRCAYLYPSFNYIFNKVNKPLALIEIGTSSGLQLFWDQYSYSYGTGESYGNINSNVHVTSEIRGENVPQLLKESPPVVERIGLDLHVNDLHSDEDYLWLRALIWPEHKERLELFDQAASLVKNKSVQLIEGDGVELLPSIIEQISEDAVICIFHTHVANQIPEQVKRKLEKQIQEIGAKRDVFHLYNNMWDRDLHIDYYINGNEYRETVGETEGHGRWFSWKLGDRSLC
ncbi:MULTISPECIES: DUF2332 domain-containing protein [Bacillus]|uniref:DUF2332 domain-containing protein n=1 Tax=Bacillus TaxID=1386 RepID=UPI0010A65056|nr:MULTISPECIES: DUF2332 domain-containing protein [Bacillus]KAB7639396.1 DUF2332 domain-containing protein [Bacillus sp. B3-WWTP-C-10-D-3]MCX9098324.1 DUF2332 domain-containing protein [Bacillus anthracis]MDA1742408.1 DUF2332 domain-containing protein [Bacillus cereus]MDQ4480788.1 DUF2332 domain-containing protein [Bacillus cereus]MEB9458381.1 DUF2332 domain-containing protein [Bacillus anthracis]